MAMSISVKILLSILVVAVITALVIGAIAVFNTRSVIAVAAVVAAFCAVVVFVCLCDQAKLLAADGDAAMKRMAETINQIKVSSGNAAEIIEAINDITVQTNRLALHATVEAARAGGEAGKRFSVVSEEARNLAARCAEVAKSVENVYTVATAVVREAPAREEKLSPIDECELWR